MLFFNFHGGPLIILLLSVFIQVSISEIYRNFQCVSFHKYDTLTFTIIFKDIPYTIQKSPTLIESPKINKINFSMPSVNTTCKVFDPVTVQDPPNGYLLYVQFYYKNNPNNPIWKPLMRFISNDVDVHRNCSSHCVIEFDDWDLGDQKQNNYFPDKFYVEERRNPHNTEFVDGPQTIYYTKGDQVIIEAVDIYNIPKGVHHVGLIQSNNNQPVLGTKYEKVSKDRRHVFHEFKYTLQPQFDGFKILIRFYNSPDGFRLRDIELLHFININSTATNHTCLHHYKIRYNLYTVEELKLSDLAANTVCPKVPKTNPSSQSETTEEIKTSTELRTTKPEKAIKTDAETKMITDHKTTVKTNGETAVTLIHFQETTINPTVRTALKTTDGITTTTNTAKILPIVLPIVAVVLVILILAGIIYWYRRDKARKPETEDTYLYATQLNYAQLELESSELYEAPKKDYVSVYTRVIGVLKPKSST